MDESFMIHEAQISLKFMCCIMDCVCVGVLYESLCWLQISSVNGSRNASDCSMCGAQQMYVPLILSKNIKPLQLFKHCAWIQFGLTHFSGYKKKKSRTNVRSAFLLQMHQLSVIITFTPNADAHQKEKSVKCDVCVRTRGVS